MSDIEENKERGHFNFNGLFAVIVAVVVSMRGFVQVSIDASTLPQIAKATLSFLPYVAIILVAGYWGYKNVMWKIDDRLEAWRQSIMERVTNLDAALTRREAYIIGQMNRHQEARIKEEGKIIRDLILMKYIEEYRKNHLIITGYKTGAYYFHDIASAGGMPAQRASYDKLEKEKVTKMLMDAFKSNEADAMIIVDRYYGAD